LIVRLVLLHTVVSAGFITVGVGLTLIRNVSGVPWQLLATGVTIIRVEAVAVVLFERKAGMFPEPPGARSPNVVLLLVQLNCVPLTLEEKFGTLT
jgi:hypothetical protein